MERKFPNLTPSRLSALVCLKQFFTVHVLKDVPKEAWSHCLAYGIAIHAIMKALFDPAISIPSGERNIANIVARVFASLHYPDPALKQADAARALQTTEAYLRQASSTEKVLGVEVFADFHAAHDGQRPLVCGAKYDLLLVREEEPDVLVVKGITKQASSAPLTLKAPASCMRWPRHARSSWSATWAV